MDIRERIMLVRSQSNLSMQSFADAIGVSIGVIKNIEYGKAPVTRVVGIAICSKFNVREEWLFHGSGMMYQEDDLIGQLCNRLNLDGNQRVILHVAASLGPDTAATLLRLARMIVKGTSTVDAVPRILASDLPPYEPEESQNEEKSG
jgi:transcriptional regulator with XRE-family HTH domain